MVEYNWWDDWTVDENDSMFCSIINNICFGSSDLDCTYCPERLAFDEYIESLKLDELGPPSDLGLLPCPHSTEQAELKP